MSNPTQAEINQALYGKGNRSKYNVDQSAAGKEKRTFVDPKTGQVIIFHSEHEMEVYRDYVLPNEHIGVFKNVRRQVRFDLHSITPGGFEVKVGTWIADFTAEDRQGKPVVMDAKGHRTDVYKLKKKMFEAEYAQRILEL